MYEDMLHGGRYMTSSRSYDIFFVALCVAITIIGCHRTSHFTTSITVCQQITPQPVRVGTSVVAIQLSDVHTNPVTHAIIQVEADMAHPGMAPVFSQAKETVPGSYNAPVDFNMRGDWVVLLHIKLADGQKLEQRVDVGGVRPN